MLEEIYKQLLKEYRVDLKLSENLCTELTLNYTQKNRYYHNLDHLEDLYSQLTKVKSDIQNWNVILFTLFYHDIIYKFTKRDNEEQSAKLAVKRMNEIGVLENDVNLCFEQIIATKSHTVSANTDTNYFTDADLSILGCEPARYKDYCQKIRKEYSVYPDFLYNKGRKKVIKHFLSMSRIYKTEEFYQEFEEQAKRNLTNEYENLW